MKKVLFIFAVVFMIAVSSLYGQKMRKRMGLENIGMEVFPEVGENISCGYGWLDANA